MRDCTGFPKRDGLVRGKLGPRFWRYHGFGHLWSKNLPERQVAVLYLRISLGFGNSIVLIDFSVPWLNYAFSWGRTRNEKELPPLLQPFSSQQNVRPLLAVCLGLFSSPNLTSHQGDREVERFALLTTQHSLPADLNDSYRGELDQATDGGKEHSIKMRVGQTEPWETWQVWYPQVHKSIISCHPLNSCQGNQRVVSAWATEEKRPPGCEFPFYSFPVTFLCTLRFIFLFPFFYFAISYLKISKQSL